MFFFFFFFFFKRGEHFFFFSQNLTNNLKGVLLFQDNISKYRFLLRKRTQKKNIDKIYIFYV